jgi:hypothetical protein
MRNRCQEETVTVWPRQSLSWRHDNDLDPYPDLPGRLRPIRISWLLELMLAGSKQSCKRQGARARVDCVMSASAGALSLPQRMQRSQVLH